MFEANPVFQLYRTVVARLPRSWKHSLKIPALWMWRPMSPYWSHYLLPYIDIHVRRKTPVIVYQMGKVGSASIYRSLQRLDNTSVHHAHSLNPDILRKQIKSQKGSSLHHQWLWLFNNVVASGIPVKYITLTRDPIATTVSGFFQNMERFTGIKDTHQHLSPDELLTEFSRSRGRFQYPLNWFDLHVKPVLDIDVYDYPFPHEQGYLRVEKGNVDLLIIRVETDDEVKERAVAEFLGLDDFSLTNTNIGADKSYGSAYREFKRTLELPPDLIDECYRSQYMQHFYSVEQIAEFRAQWIRGLSGGDPSAGSPCRR